MGGNSHTPAESFRPEARILRRTRPRSRGAAFAYSTRGPPVFKPVDEAAAQEAASQHRGEVVQAMAAVTVAATAAHLPSTGTERRAGPRSFSAVAAWLALAVSAGSGGRDSSRGSDDVCVSGLG